MAATQHGFQPTAAAIRRACQAIQASWNDRERERRAPYLRARAWSVPLVDQMELPPGEELTRDWE